MSFFGGFGDPFFGDMHRMMRHQMRDMEDLMGAMMFDPFGMGPRRPPGITYGHPSHANDNHYGHSSRHHVDPRAMDPMAMMMQPFGFGGGMFGGLHNMMQQMDQMQHQALTDPNGHVYTQSTMVSVAPGADGRPQVYESRNSTRKVGDVKETRRSVRDSARGEERMSIGHHIGDRGHVIEKRRDRNTGGRIVEQQEFIGLQEDEAEKFDSEWSRATRRAASGDRYRLDHDGSRRRGNSNLAIEAGCDSDRIYRTASPHGTHRARIATSDQGRRHSPYHHTPPRRRIVRIEEPPEEPEQTENSKSKPSTSGSGSGSGGGPIIEEIE